MKAGPSDPHRASSYRRYFASSVHYSTLTVAVSTKLPTNSVQSLADTGTSPFFFEKDIFHYLKAQYRYGAKHTPIKVLECSLHSTLSRMYICFAREKARTRNCCLSCLLCEPVSHLVCVPVDLDDRMLHAIGDFCELSKNWSQ